MENTAPQPSNENTTEQNRRPHSAQNRRLNAQRFGRADSNIFRNRDSGLFMHYVFITLSMRYANFFKPTARRLIEFFTLMNAIFVLCLMIYIHTTFVKDSGHCLDDIKSIWPKHGVLKVQVEANTSLPPYQFYFAKANQETWATSFEMDPYQAVFKYSVKIGKDGVAKFTKTPPMSQNKLDQSRPQELFGLKEPKQCPVIETAQFQRDKLREMFIKRFSDITPEMDFISPMKVEEIPRWVLIDPSISDTLAEIRMLQMQEVAGFTIGPQPVREYYAIEYSTEFGYLRLSAVTRYKLGIPVMVVTLGFLRNLVTGEHFKFITLWVGQSSYILAFTVMLIFTLVVTMLLRYSYHQIFVFMAPMLTIILALVGTEEIMTEFFHDSTLAFYVILSIWVADQFDVICMHTVAGRRHWVRFFFLYHFAFYAYHYRYNGQFSEMALLTSWLFIQHSMLYFLHHYEIPAIHRQIQLSRVLLQNNNMRNPPPDPSQEDPSNDAAPETTPDAPPSDSSPEPANPSPEIDAPAESSETTDNIEPETESSTTEISETQSSTTSELQVPPESGNGLEDSNDDADLIKCINNIELWEEFPTILTENSTVRNTEGFLKYCNLIMLLILALSAIILVFVLSIVMFNQGKLNATFGGYRIEKVGEFVL